MYSEFFANHIRIIFLFIFVLFALGILSSRKKPRNEPADPPLIYGPIRGMFVCYQCDTIFNMQRCPGCNEEAAVPLVHLTGSITEDERIAAVVGKLRKRMLWDVPAIHPPQNLKTILSAPAFRLESSNGGPPEVPMTISIPNVGEKSPTIS